MALTLPVLLLFVDRLSWMEYSLNPRAKYNLPGKELIKSCSYMLFTQAPLYNT